MNFTTQLIARRKECGLTQEQLAEKLNVTRQAVSKWESGLSSPDYDTLGKLCEVLETTPNQLLGYLDVNQTAKAEKPMKRQFLPFALFMMLIFFSGFLTFMASVLIYPDIILLCIGFFLMLLSLALFLAAWLWSGKRR